MGFTKITKYDPTLAAIALVREHYKTSNVEVSLWMVLLKSTENF